MMLGMTLSTFTLFHVVLSLVGIASGLIVVYGLLTGERLDTWTAIFLIFTVLTGVTGFLFPTQNTPPFLITQLVVMAIFILLTILAARRFHLLPVARTA
jgi:hypothetical protein